MAFNQAFNSITGDLYQPSVAAASLTEAFRSADSPEKRLVALVANTYTRALMSGDDNEVIAGIRVNIAGRMEQGGLSPTARFIRNMLDQMLIQQISEDLNRLREIEREQEEIRAEMRSIEAKYMSAEDMEQGFGESDQDFYARKKAILEAAVASGDMTQSEFDEWSRLNERLVALELEKEQILDRISEYDSEVVAYRELSRQRDELQARLSGLDKGIEKSEGGLTRLRQIRELSATDASSALDVLLVDYPDVQVDLPDDADIYTRIDLIQASITADADDARREQIDLQQTLDATEAARDVVEARAGDQIAAVNTEAEIVRAAFSSENEHDYVPAASLTLDNFGI